MSVLAEAAISSANRAKGVTQTLLPRVAAGGAIVIVVIIPDAQAGWREVVSVFLFGGRKGGTAI